ncbi:MAG TPA: response regulator, partial [Tepidisphaeraceae bacterium]
MSEKHTILLVDDQPTLVKALRVLLRKDYRVLSAPNAAEAEAILEREDVHVVMSDQVMPGTSGIEFLHKVRERHPDAIRLLFTGDTDVRTVVDAVNEGSIHRYIIKPCDPRQLQSILREACERHDMIAERAQLLADLRQKNEQLERVNFELHQSDQLKNAFIEVASHELRTPLTILLGLARLAERVPGLSTMVMDLLRRMEQAGLRLQRLVDQLVALLSSDGIQRPLRRSPVALAELLQQAADDVR